MNNIELFHEKRNCCGCGACCSICPKNAIKMTGYGAKIGAGYVGRFAFIATVVMSLFTDTAVKISHKIYGRPLISILD